MVLDRFFQQIASDVLLKFLMLFLKSRDISPSVSVANFGHCFFGWVRCEQNFIAPIYSLTETRLYLKLLLGFSVEPIRTRVNGIQVK